MKKLILCLTIAASFAVAQEPAPVIAERSKFELQRIYTKLLAFEFQITDARTKLQGELQAKLAELQAVCAAASLVLQGNHMEEPKCGAPVVPASQKPMAAGMRHQKGEAAPVETPAPASVIPLPAQSVPKPVIPEEDEDDKKKK